MAALGAEIKEALADLTRRGDRLQLALIAKAPAGLREQVAELIDPPNDKKSRQQRGAKGRPTNASKEAAYEVTAVLTEDFGPAYQAWYSLALPVVEQILPDRHTEFRAPRKASIV